MTEIGSDRDHGGQHGQIGSPAYFIKFVVVFQLIGDRDQILRLISFKELDHGLKNFFMGRAIKIGWLQDFKNSTKRLILEQDCAQDRLLGLQILGRDPASGLVCRGCGHGKELTHLEADRERKKI